MGHRMLIGRDSLPDGTLVDSSQTFIVTAKFESEYKKAQSDNYRKPLKIGLLASNQKLYSNQRILEAGKILGHKMMFLNIKNCYIDVQHRTSTIHCRDFDSSDIASINAIIPRIRPNLTFYGCALVRQFQTMGKYCLNGADAIAHARDKLKALQILASKFIPMPVTTFAASTQETKHLIELVGGAPLVIKLLEGTQGQGVVLVESNSAAESVISAFKSANANILVQEFISESRGQDIRCLVIDYKVVGSMLRKAQSPGEFRANFHLGGTVESVKLTPTERKIAVSAARILGLPVAGVDIIRSKKGPMILEVNSAPGLQGIEEATGEDIAREMILCLERHCYGKRGTN
jgi:ribosomal protein S6--L-glutamate ligase